jgi:hypothetical protein
MQLDPFRAGDRGIASCPAAKPRLYTNERGGAAGARAQRARHALRDGGHRASRRRLSARSEINDAVRAAIAGDKRVAKTVGMDHDQPPLGDARRLRREAGTQRNVLVKFVAHQPRVERVFDELTCPPK